MQLHLHLRSLVCESTKRVKHEAFATAACDILPAELHSHADDITSSVRTTRQRSWSHMHDSTTRHMATI